MNIRVTVDEKGRFIVCDTDVRPPTHLVCIIEFHNHASALFDVHQKADLMKLVSRHLDPVLLPETQTCDGCGTSAVANPDDPGCNICTDCLEKAYG